MRLSPSLTTLVLAAGLLVGCSVAEPAALDQGARGALGEGDAHARPAPSTTGETAAPATPDGPDDEAPRGTEDWRMSRPAPDGALDAYTTAVSGMPGEPLEVKVSTMAPSYRLEVYRLGAYDGGSSAPRARTRAGGRPGAAGGRAAPGVAPGPSSRPGRST